MWKAAFSGRSETGSVSGRPSSHRKKSRTGSEISSSSRKPEDERRKSRGSTYEDEDARASTYVTAPSSRAGEPRGLTESALGMLDRDDDEGWVDDDRDARSDRKSVRSDGSRKHHRHKSERERSRSHSRDRKSGRSSKSSRRDPELSRRESRTEHEGGERAIPDMGSMQQFPGQYAGGEMGQAGQQDHMMSGALPGAPNNQFGPVRVASYGEAAEYYMDQGESIQDQPGFRQSSPNMLVNPDLHLMAASAEAHPAEDTGHGSAADFYTGKVSPVLTEEPQPISSKPGKHSFLGSSKPSRPGKVSSNTIGTAATVAAAGGLAGAAMGVAGITTSHQAQNQNQTSTSTSYQQVTNSGSRPIQQFKPNRHNSEPRPTSSGTYYGPPPSQQQQNLNQQNPGKQSSHSNAGLYAAGAAGVAAAGLSAYEMNQHGRPQPQVTPSTSPYGGTAYVGPPSYGQQQTSYSQSNMHQHEFHEHRGPMTRLKDGLFNLISSEEDTIKMEMYTEYIGVCKHCFDPRSSPYDAPRRHHYHATSRRDSFEDLRKRRSIEKMRRAGSSRVDKDSRYYSSDAEKRRRKSGNKTDLVGAGLAAAGVATGANALFNNDRKDFDDTYSVKSGHRESSAVRRRSRSSSREKRRRSTYGVVGKESQDEYITVRTKDGRVERRPVHRSRSRSRDRKAGLMAAGAGAALGASAIAASSRQRQDHGPNGAFVRSHSRSQSRSSSEGGGVLGSFFSPSRRKKKERDPRREHRKKQAGFFSFGNASGSSSDEELAFTGGDRQNLPLRRKPSTRSTRPTRKKSDEHIAATVAGIGATAAALAAAQKGQRVSKRTSRPELGPGRDVRRDQHAKDAHRHGEHGYSDDEWEDELPSDVDDASSVEGLAFGDYGKRPSKRQSMESLGSQSSNDGLSAWGWRWGGKDKKRRRASPEPPPYPVRPEDSSMGAAATGLAAAAVAGGAWDAASRPMRSESGMTSSSSIPQQPMQYVDPRPLSDAGSMSGSRHASMPGSFDPPFVGRPGPAPLQQPKPVAPIQPAFTQIPPELDEYEAHRPSKPRRTQSSPTQSSWGKDAAIIGAAALGTAGIIASQARKSREPKDVRFGLTEEQERKHERERREEQKRADEERRRNDRERALKQEAERHTREQDVLRAREEENRRAAENELQRQRAAQREAEEQAEMDLQREQQERERFEAYNRDMARREEETRLAESERHERERNEQVMQDNIQIQKQGEPDRRRQYDDDPSPNDRQAQESSKQSSVPWGAMAAGAAAAGVGAYALSEHERRKGPEPEQEPDIQRYGDEYDVNDAYEARVVTPTEEKPPESFDDDDIYDPEYFKRRNRSQSDYARHVELARRAADKIVADQDAYYNAPQQSQADFFAPKDILAQKPEGKTKVADPVGDNEILDEREAAARAFDREHGVAPSGQSRYAPFGVPKLGLVSPTPPPSAPPSATKSSMRPSSSPLSQTEDVEPQDEEVDANAGRSARRKSSRSRSVSWGGDQTHIYDVPTPDSHHEKEDYVDGNHHAAALHEITVEPASPGEGPEKTTYRVEDLARDAQQRRHPEEEDVEEVIEDAETPPTYRRSFFDSVSDIGLGGLSMDSPGTEGAPPVQGFVEGEVEATPAEEKSPHIPGGFDDDDDEVVRPAMSPGAVLTKDTRSTAMVEPQVQQGANDVPLFERSPEPEAEPSWEPPLTKKEKRKREKAAKRSSTLDSEPTTPLADESPAPIVDPEPELQDEPDYFVSKKDKKKRDKALKRGLSNDEAITVQKPRSDDLVDEGASSLQPELEPEPAWEPPLSKKEKKKREKDAKRSGFGDVAAALMTTGGLAAAASAAGDDKNVERSGGRPDETSATVLDRDTRNIRDIRDVEPSVPVSLETGAHEPTAMPGSWDSEYRDSEGESNPRVVDTFQYQIRDEASPPPEPQEADPFSEFAETKKSKKKKKRDSTRFNEPPVGSPLRSEVPSEDYIGEPESQQIKQERPTESALPINGYSLEAPHAEASAAYSSAIADLHKAYDNHGGRPSEYHVDNRPFNDASHRLSREDAWPVETDPAGGDRNGLRDPNGDLQDHATQLYDEPELYDDTRSVAASEATSSHGSSRKHKRRSRTEDDDTASVVSSRSRRETDDVVPAKSDKKGGLFGIFSRKSSESVPLSRQSTRDSRDDELETDERKHHRRRKHRDSEYGDDEYDEQRRDSESGHRHHHRHHEDEDDRSRSRQDSQSSHRHHHRHRTDEAVDDQDQSFLGMRVEDMPPLPDSPPVSPGSASVKEEQDIGKLVSAEPGTGTVSREHADAFDLLREEDVEPHSPVGPENPDTHGVIRDHANAFDLLRQENQTGPLLADSEKHDSRSLRYATEQPPWQDQVEYLPALPDSRPDSPTAFAETEVPQRPFILQRPTSTTAVPLRFPFRQQPPQTPGRGMERSASFGASLPSSPASPSTAQRRRQGRPMSTEVRPLYLVERNRKTPEVEEMLPSLPSSKPSSRASSMVGSDEYESAVEDVDHPEHRRVLAIDADHANRYEPDEDYLDSQQTTPRAGEFSQSFLDKFPRQEPQFYTWADFEQDERLHNATAEGSSQSIDPGDDGAVSAGVHPSDRVVDADHRQASEDDSPPLPASRPQSPTAEDNTIRAATGMAAAAGLAGAVALGYKALDQYERPLAFDQSQSAADGNEEHDSAGTADVAMARPTSESSEALGSVNDTSREAEFDESPLLSRKSSKKKNKKGQKPKKLNLESLHDETASARPPTSSPTPSQEAESFVQLERSAEEGSVTVTPKEIQPPLPSQGNDMDRFLQAEALTEEGGISSSISSDTGVTANILSPEPSDRLARFNTDIGTLEAPSTGLRDDHNSKSLLEGAESTETEQTMLPETFPVYSELPSQTLREADSLVEASAVAPALLEDEYDVQEFMQSEDQMEAGLTSATVQGQPSLAREVVDDHLDENLNSAHTTGQRSAILSTEPVPEEDTVEISDVDRDIPVTQDSEVPSAEDFAPVLTRKQSKKAAKKKQKGAAKQVLDATPSSASGPGGGIANNGSSQVVATGEATNDQSTDVAGFGPSAVEGEDDPPLPERMREDRDKRDTLDEADNSKVLSDIPGSAQSMSDRDVPAGSILPDDMATASFTGADNLDQNPYEAERVPQEDEQVVQTHDHDDGRSQPDQGPEESWEAFPNVSRKQSKKSSKRRKQQERESYSQPRCETTPVDRKTSASEQADVIDSSTARLDAPTVMQPQDPAITTGSEMLAELAMPEEVPLPPADDEEDLKDVAPTKSRTTSVDEATSGDSRGTVTDVISTTPGGFSTEPDSILSKDSDQTRVHIDSDIRQHQSSEEAQVAGVIDGDDPLDIAPSQPYGFSTRMGPEGDAYIRTSGADISARPHSPPVDLEPTNSALEHAVTSSGVPRQVDFTELAVPIYGPEAEPQEMTHTVPGVDVVEPDVELQDAELPDALAADLGRDLGADAPTESETAPLDLQAPVDNAQQSFAYVEGRDPDQTADASERDQPPLQKPDEDFAWTTSSKKQSKKGKKGRKKSSAYTSVEDGHEDGEQLQQDVTISAPEASLATTAAVIEPEQSLTSGQEKDVEDPEDFWSALPSKKKKGKKGKKSLPQTPPILAEPRQPATIKEVNSFEHPETAIATEESASEDVEPTEAIPQSRKISSSDDATTHGEAISTEEAPNPDVTPAVGEAIVTEREVTPEQLPVAEDVTASPVFPQTDTVQDVDSAQDDQGPDGPSSVEDSVERPLVDLPGSLPAPDLANLASEDFRGVVTEEPVASEFTESYVAPDTTMSEDNRANPIKEHAPGESSTLQTSTDVDNDVDDSFWATPSKKRSKRDKKSKMSIPQYPSDAPNTPTEDPATAPVEEPKPIVATEPEDYWSAPSKGKKGKKSRKFTAMESEPEEVHVLTTATPQQLEDGLAERTVDDTPVEVESSTNPNEVEPADIWSVPVKKQKSKKGKKSKRVDFDAEATTATEQGQPSVDGNAGSRGLDEPLEFGSSNNVQGVLPTDSPGPSAPVPPEAQDVRASNDSVEEPIPEASPSRHSPRLEPERDDQWSLAEEVSRGVDDVAADFSTGELQQSESRETAGETGISQDPRAARQPRIASPEHMLGNAQTVRDSASEMAADLPGLQADAGQFTTSVNQVLPSPDAPDGATESKEPEQNYAASGSVTEAVLQEATTPSAVMEEKKEKRRKKSRISTLNARENDFTEETHQSEREVEADQLSLGTAPASNALGAAATPAEAEQEQEEEWPTFSRKKSKKEKRKAKKGGISTPTDAPDPAPFESGLEPTGSGGGGDRDSAGLDVLSAKDNAAATSYQEPVNRSLQGSRNEAESVAQDRNDPTWSPVLDAESDQVGQVNVYGDEIRGIVDERSGTPTMEHHEDAAVAEAVSHVESDNDTMDIEDTPANVPLPQDTHEDLLQAPRQDQGTPLESPNNDDATSELDHHTARQAGINNTTQSNVDFTATVAAGLADSGFNPDMVVNDPAFQRRASPPGMVAEADPDEVFETTTKRKKGKKGRKTAEASGNTFAEQRPELENRQVPREASEGFNDTVEGALAGTGFDPALLQRTVASSNAEPANEVTGDPMEFSFAAPKRKKSKKSKANKDDFSIEPLERGHDVSLDGTHQQDNFRALEDDKEPATYSPDGYPGQASIAPPPAAGEELQSEALPPVSKQWAASQEVHQPQPDWKEIETLDRANDNVPEQSLVVQDPAVDLVVAGDRDMDVDEMDKAYRAFKKSKRNKKKQKAEMSQAKAVLDNDNAQQVIESLPQSHEPESTQPASDATDMEFAPNLEGNDVNDSDAGIDPSEQRRFSASRLDNGLFHLASEAAGTSFYLPQPEPSALSDLPSLNNHEKYSGARESAGSDVSLHISEVSDSLPKAVGRVISPVESTVRDESADGPEENVMGPESTSSSAVERHYQGDAFDRGEGIRAADVGTDAATPTAGTTPSLKRDASDGFQPRAKPTRQQPDPDFNTFSGERAGINSAPSWSFATLEGEGEPLPESPLLGTKSHQVIRDSGYQEGASPDPNRYSTESTSREVPQIYTVHSRESLRSRRSQEPLHISTEASDWDLDIPRNRTADDPARTSASLHTRTPSRETAETPLESTTKNRASYLFQSTPEKLRQLSDPSELPTPEARSEASDYSRTGSREMPHEPEPFQRSTLSPPPTGAMSPRGPLNTIVEERHAHKRTIGETGITAPTNTKAIRRTETPQAIRARERAMSPKSLPPVVIPSESARSFSNPLSTDELSHRLPWPAVDEDQDAINVNRPLKRKSSKPASVAPRSPSVLSSRSNASANHFRSPEELRSFSRISNRSSTPTLRRVDRSLSGDLRAASRRGEAGSAVGARSSPRTIPFEPPPTPPSNDDEVMDAGASRSADMSNVYQGYGDATASSVSPTRPPNMRKRQSMHIMELESRLDQLANENQALHEAKQERGISADQDDFHEALSARDLQLQEKESQINQIKALLQPMQEEISRLTEINGGLTEANRNLVDDTNGRYATLQQEHAQTHEQWQNTSRELESVRQEHGRVTIGMREIVETEVAARLADKNSEIRQLQEDLDIANEKIRALQVQIQSTRGRDFLTTRDEDYFDGACQKLCQHVQQWVLRFSKVSDNRICRLSTDLKDEKIEARLDNAILDGSDVDKLLGDRIRRRDVFMSVLMTMVWEYVFTRYLFGMDREQRQKLKALEKILQEVGPPRAVAQWRATTLTLLAKRPAFAEQRDLDTEAVSNEIFALLCALLPPPSSSEQQLLASLQRVIGIAVDLSIEMRTQRAEFIMLPPLQPEYDTNGDLVRKVHFNASLMNERSGMFSSNEGLEQSRAVVKIVLFPLVVKKGDEVGEGEEEIVVCPAQVLVHNDNNKGKKIVRVQSGAMEIDDPRQSRGSLISPGGSVAF